MNDSDAERFGIAMVAASEVFDKKLTAPQIEMYFQALEDLSIDQIELAFKQAIRSSTFMPRPADIRKLAVGSDEDDALLAWADVVGAQRIGPYKSVCFRNSLINVTIRAMGGWPTLLSRCATHSEEGRCRSEFLRLYPIIKNRKLDNKSRLPLPGLHPGPVVFVSCNSTQTQPLLPGESDESERPAIEFKRP